jgi:BirA family transcriptional regulator, biotin operon repressor / biotin---[acetyl-CoA-carboxylase] ligase
MTPSPDLPAGYALAAFDTIGSTNDEAKRRAGEGAPEGAVVWARSQTGGRGREDRSWVSPPGNLYCSVVLRPAAISAQLGFAAALAAAEAVGADATLKWPNDVLLGGRKVAGLLLEAGTGWTVIGCGINLISHPEDTPFPATSVKTATGHTISAETALSAFCAALDRWYRRWKGEGFGAVREAWLARAHAVGTALTVRTPRVALAGTFGGLDADGVLLLKAIDGRLHRIAAGDVYFPCS